MSQVEDQDEDITWADLAAPIVRKMTVAHDMNMTLTYEGEPLLVIAGFIKLMASKLDEHGVELPEE
jgi:hypothetical protein